MYNCPFTISEINELAAIAELADYYLARPVLSSTLPAALYRTRESMKMIMEHSVAVINLATVLRCDVLFRQAFVLCLGPFHEPLFKQFPDGPLRDLAEKKYTALRSQVLETQEEIMKSALLVSPYHVVAVLKYAVTGRVSWPQYFRSISPSENFMRQLSIKKIMADMLQNVSSFPLAYKSGSGDFKEHFLCVKVSDDELPWDITETDF